MIYDVRGEAERLVTVLLRVGIPTDDGVLALEVALRAAFEAGAMAQRRMDRESLDVTRWPLVIPEDP